MVGNPPTIIRSRITRERAVEHTERAVVVNPPAIIQSRIARERAVEHTERSVVGNPSAITQSRIARKRAVEHTEYSIVENPPTQQSSIIARERAVKHTERSIVGNPPAQTSRIAGERAFENSEISAKTNQNRATGTESCIAIRKSKSRQLAGPSRELKDAATIIPRDSEIARLRPLNGEVIRDIQLPLSESQNTCQLIVEADDIRRRGEIGLRNGFP